MLLELLVGSSVPVRNQFMRVGSNAVVRVCQILTYNCTPSALFKNNSDQRDNAEQVGGWRPRPPARLKNDKYFKELLDVVELCWAQYSSCRPDFREVIEYLEDSKPSEETDGGSSKNGTADDQLDEESENPDHGTSSEQVKIMDSLEVRNKALEKELAEYRERSKSSTPPEQSEFVGKLEARNKELEAEVSELRRSLVTNPSKENRLENATEVEMLREDALKLDKKNKELEAIRENASQ